ncbi:MAG TPA: hypothetical protein DHU63_05220 [Candidatus Marinimicrobia bacterium]|nr:hypothetical protein [Candidatus Neomarinimicrobiota bacterium]
MNTLKLVFTLLVVLVGFGVASATSVTIENNRNFSSDPAHPGEKTVVIREYLVVGEDGFSPIDEIVITGGIGIPDEGVGLSYAYENPFVDIVRIGQENCSSIDFQNFGNEYDEPTFFHFNPECGVDENQIVTVRLYADVRKDVTSEVRHTINSDPKGVISSITLLYQGEVVRALYGGSQPVSIVQVENPRISIGMGLYLSPNSIPYSDVARDVRFDLNLLETSALGAIIAVAVELEGDGVSDPLTMAADFVHEPPSGMISETRLVEDTVFIILTVGPEPVSNLGNLVINAVPAWVRAVHVEFETRLTLWNGYETEELDGETTIVVDPPTPPIVVHKDREAVVIGDTLKITIEGGQPPFEVLVSDDPNLYTVVAGSSEREFLLVPVPDWMQNWPDDDETGGPIYYQVSDKYYAETSTVMVKARFGDISGNGEITPYDASLLLRGMLELVKFVNYQILVADFDRDGDVRLLDVANILRYTVGLPLIAHATTGGGGAAGKISVDILDETLAILDHPKLDELSEEDKALIRDVLVNARGEIAPILPNQFALAPNFPNPFNASTTIQYDVPTDGHVTLEIYDALGQHVATLADENHLAGQYQVVWPADGAASGLYFVRMRAANFSQVRRMTLLK